MLIKPHYESERYMLQKGKLKEEYIPVVLEKIRNFAEGNGIQVISETESPILGEKGKNKEYLMYMKRVG